MFSENQTYVSGAHIGVEKPSLKNAREVIRARAFASRQV